jgi:hypothetical protein
MPGMCPTSSMAQSKEAEPTSQFPRRYGVTPSKPLLAAQPDGPAASETQNCE